MSEKSFLLLFFLFILIRYFFFSSSASFLLAWHSFFWIFRRKIVVTLIISLSSLSQSTVRLSHQLLRFIQKYSELFFVQKLSNTMKKILYQLMTHYSHLFVEKNLVLTDWVLQSRSFDKTIRTILTNAVLFAEWWKKDNRIFIELNRSSSIDYSTKISRTSEVSSSRTVQIFSNISLDFSSTTSLRNLVVHREFFKISFHISNIFKIFRDSFSITSFTTNEENIMTNSFHTSEQTQTIREMLQTMIQDTLSTLIQTTINNIKIAERQSDQQKTSSSNSILVKTKRWIVVDIDYFDLMYDNKFIYTRDLMKNAKKDIYFRDVHLFLERVKDHARIKNSALIRKNLFTCLRDLTLQWYTSELSKNIKNLLRLDKVVKFWKKELFKRFKEASNMIMINLVKEKYSMNDVRRRRESREYVDVIFRASKFANLIAEISQIFLIYNELDVKFQRDITMSKIDTKLDSFFIELNDMKNVWWQLTDRKRRSFFEQTIYQNTQFYDNTRSRSRFARSRQQYKERFYDFNYSRQSRNFSQFFDSSSDKTFSTLIFSYFSSIAASQIDFINKQQKSSLVSDFVTNVNENENRREQFRNRINYSFFNQDSTTQSSFIFLRSSKDEEYRNRIYQAEWNDDNINEKKKDCQNEKNTSINFVEYDEHDNELYYDEIFMKNSNVKYEIFVEFVNLKSACTKCKKSFLSRNKLHKHLKKNCDKFTINQIVIKTTSSVQSLASSNASIIIKFTAFIADKKYDLAFRKWNYVEAIIKLTIVDEEIYICLNIEIEVSLANRQFVLDKLLNAHIHNMTNSFTIREIEINIHEIKKYVNFSMYFFSQKNSFVMTEIQREIHLIQEFRVNMLIENDILRSEEIIIDIVNRRAIIVNCDNMMIDVKIHQRDSYVKKNVRNQFAMIIFSEVYAKVSYVVKNLSNSRNFLFQSSFIVFVFMYAHIINVTTTEVIIRNESRSVVIILKNYKFDVAQKIEYENCFYASQKHHLILHVLKKN